MKSYLSLSLLLASSITLAGMPYISNNTSDNFERVTSGDITCEGRTAVPTVNTGVYSSNTDANIGYNNTLSDKGFYVALSIPLTSKKSSKVNCEGLYQTALQKEQLRVKQLEMQVENLKARRLTVN